LLGVIFGIIYYAQKTLSEIEAALPITLSKQEHDIHELMHDMATLVQDIGFTQSAYTPERFKNIITQINVLDRALQTIRQDYQFNDTLGISAIHAVLNPAMSDVKLWLTQGIYNFRPESVPTLQLAAQRSRLAYEQAGTLLSGVTQTAFDVLATQADRISNFRNFLIATLIALTLMAIGLVTLGIRLQRMVYALKQSEEKIRFRANYDSLTQLPNRPNFIEHLNDALAQGKRNSAQFALLFIDLDRFKTINDTLGHDCGDELLKQVAGRLLEGVRKTDMVARLGGDEFTVLLTDLTDEMRASLIARKILARLSVPFLLLGHEIFSAASIGIAMFPGDGSDANTLLKNADMAMYESKNQGRNTFHFFAEQMTSRAQHFLDLDEDMRRALAQDELRLHYQPIYNLRDQSLVGVEALLRWQHPTKGLILPTDFISVAEETGFIVEIGLWVLGRACAEAMTWLSAGIDSDFYLAVNISMRQFNEDFCEKQVSEILQETGFPANNLLLEITESILIAEDKQVEQTLADYRQMGIRLAIDDFGTGYSSLSYLQHFSVTSLKINSSFIHGMDTNHSSRLLVEAIIAMAHTLDLLVVAEGVETQQQATLLAKLKCDMVQGNLFGRPSNVHDIETRYLQELA